MRVRRGLTALAAQVLATVLLLGLVVPREAHGQQAVSDIPDERLTTFARAHVEISSVRDSLYDAFGRIHDAQGKASLREKLNERVTQILEAQGLSVAEFEQITFVISVDAGQREEFETILTELNPASPPREPERLETARMLTLVSGLDPAA